MRSTCYAALIGTLALTCAAASLAQDQASAPKLGSTAERANPASQTFPAQCYENTCYTDQFPGSDVGAQINAAYAALPARGGIIYVSTTGYFSTPIVFNTPGKPAVLTGVPGSGAFGVALTYAQASGTAITLDWGSTAMPGAGVRDLALAGGGGTSVGIMLGGSHGAVETLVSNVTVVDFGVNVEIGSNAYLNRFDACDFRAGVTHNLLIAPGGSIENVSFDHCVFSDAPPPYTNSVVILSQGDFEFVDCSFDQAQLVATANAIVSIKGGHFENSNQGSPYDFIDFSGNTLHLLGTDILQILTSGTGPAEAINISGGSGTVVLSATEFFSGLAQSSFIRIAAGANPSVYVYGHHDASNAYTGPFVAGTTSGTVMLLPDPITKNFLVSGTGTAATASSGSSGAPPAQVAGYLVVNIGGNLVKIPYYNN